MKLNANDKAVQFIVAVTKQRFEKPTTYVDKTGASQENQAIKAQDLAEPLKKIDPKRFDNDPGTTTVREQKVSKSGKAYTAIKTVGNSAAGILTGSEKRIAFFEQMVAQGFVQKVWKGKVPYYADNRYVAKGGGGMSDDVAATLAAFLK